MPIIETLVVEEYGAFVGKKQGRVVVTVKDKTVAEAPLLHLQTIVVASNGVSVSSDVLAACCEEGIPIHFVDSRGRAYASVYSAGLTGTRRRENNPPRSWSRSRSRRSLPDWHPTRCPTGSAAVPAD